MRIYLESTIPSYVVAHIAVAAVHRMDILLTWNCRHIANAVIVVADAHTTGDNPILKAELVRQQHNWAWAHCLSSKGVTVLEASQVRFPVSAGA